MFLLYEDLYLKNDLILVILEQIVQNELNKLYTVHIYYFICIISYFCIWFLYKIFFTNKIIFYFFYKFNFKKLLNDFFFYKFNFKFIQLYLVYLNKFNFFYYKNNFFYYKNVFFLKNFNFFILDDFYKNFLIYNDFQKDNFFFNIFYSNTIIKFIFNNFFRKFEKNNTFFYKFFNIRKNINFKYKVHFNKSLTTKYNNFLSKLFFYNLITIFNYKIFCKFLIFFFKDNKKKLTYLNFKKRLELSQNIFNITMFNYYYNNLYSLMYLNNLYIFNIFNLNFYLKNDESYDKNLINYNNLYPIFKRKDAFFESKFINKNVFNFDKFFNIFILTFYEKLFKSFFFIKFNFNLNLKNFYKNYYKNYPFSISSSQQDHYTIDEMFEIFCFSFVKRDINILNTWILNKMNKINFRNHKKFLTVIQHFLFHYRYFFVYILNIEGFFIKVKGKLSVAGNAKKKVFFYKIGKVNLSKKINKIEHSQSVIKSTYGVLGLNMFLSY